jgi:D-amino-acid dehydrogenase
VARGGPGGPGSARPGKPGFDLAVIGGGLVGLCLAYEALGAGARVVLFDRGDRGRATDAGAGILAAEAACLTKPDNQPWRELATASARHWRDLVGELGAQGAPDTGFAECGYLLVSYRPGDDQAMEWAARALAEHCGPAATEVPAEQARSMFPVLGPLRRCLWLPQAARVDGRRAAAAVRQAAARRGLEVRAEAVEALSFSGRRALGVRVGGEEVPAGAVAVAGGAWSAELASQLGVSLPVGPQKGQIVHLELPGADTAGWPVVQPVLGHYLVAWPGGRVACGGTVEPAAGFDARPTAGAARELLSECLSVAPGLAQASLLELRAGLRPASADELPVLGRLPGWDNVFVATGHGANGLLMGPYSAKLVAAQALGSSGGHGLVGGQGLLAAFTAQRFGPPRP